MKHRTGSIASDADVAAICQGSLSAHIRRTRSLKHGVLCAVIPYNEFERHCKTALAMPALMITIESHNRSLKRAQGLHLEFPLHM